MAFVLSPLQLSLLLIIVAFVFFEDAAPLIVIIVIAVFVVSQGIELTFKGSKETVALSIHHRKTEGDVNVREKT